jgi:hypothetical protein
MDFNKLKTYSSWSLSALCRRHWPKAAFLAACIFLAQFRWVTESSFQDGHMRWVSEARMQQLSECFKQHLLRTYPHRQEGGTIVLSDPGSCLFSLADGTLVVSECMARCVPSDEMASFTQAELRARQAGALHADVSLGVACRLSRVEPHRVTSQQAILLRDLLNFPLKHPMPEGTNRCRVDG